MFENPYDYYTDPIIWVLFLSVTLLLILCIGFIAYTLTIRVANAKRIIKREELKKSYADQIYVYLTGDKNLDKVEETISISSTDIQVYFETAKELKEQLEGEKDKMLGELISISPIKDYYYEQLDDDKDEEIIEALLYFRELKSIKEEYYQKLMDWIEDGEHYLAHVAASVLLSTNAKSLHHKVLKTMSSRVKQNYRTLIELLWDFWINDKVEHDYKLEVLKKILHDDEIENRVKVLIINSMGEFGDYDTGRFIENLLDEIWEEHNPETAKEVIVVLVDSLRRLDYSKAVKTIKKLLECGIPDIEKACIKALSYFRTNDAIEILQELAEEGRDYLLKELSFQMYKFPKLEEQIEIPTKFRREYSPNYEPLKVFQGKSES